MLRESQRVRSGGSSPRRPFRLVRRFAVGDHGGHGARGVGALLLVVFVNTSAGAASLTSSESRAIPHGMPSIDDEIRSKTDAFVSNLTVLIRRAALESVSAVLGGSTPVAAPVQVAAKRGRGRPKKVVSAAPAAKAPPVAKTTKPVPAAKAASQAPVSKKAAAPKRVSGEKRPPAELAKLTEKLGEYIKSHPGLRIESIGKALSTPTKELALPIKKLLAAKRVKSEGQKRATVYLPA